MSEFGDRMRAMSGMGGGGATDKGPYNRKVSYNALDANISKLTGENVPDFAVKTVNPVMKISIDDVDVDEDNTPDVKPLLSGMGMNPSSALDTLNNSNRDKLE